MRPLQRIVSIQVGRVGEIGHRGSTLRTAIQKRPVPGTHLVTETGLVGDAQADRVNHGGQAKALCVYPLEHYEYWAHRLGSGLSPGAFGENLTACGLTETQACIGDTYGVGTALVQVSQPRQPCYRLAALHRQPQLAHWVQETGFTGFYLRVLLPGHLAAGDELILEARPHPGLTVSEANRAMHVDRDDRAAIERLIVPELAARWRQRLRDRLNGIATDETARLEGA